jgi:hypothetical protein
VTTTDVTRFQARPGGGILNGVHLYDILDQDELTAFARKASARDDFFDTESPASLWLAGLIAADGSIVRARSGRAWLGWRSPGVGASQSRGDDVLVPVYPDRRQSPEGFVHVSCQLRPRRRSGRAGQVIAGSIVFIIVRKAGLAQRVWARSHSPGPGQSRSSASRGAAWASGRPGRVVPRARHRSAPCRRGCGLGGTSWASSATTTLTTRSPTSSMATQTLDEARHTADPVYLIRVLGIVAETAIKDIDAAYPERRSTLWR